MNNSSVTYINPNHRLQTLLEKNKKQKNGQKNKFENKTKNTFGGKTKSKILNDAPDVVCVETVIFQLFVGYGRYGENKFTCWFT